MFPKEVNKIYCFKTGLFKLFDEGRSLRGYLSTVLIDCFGYNQITIWLRGPGWATRGFEAILFDCVIASFSLKSRRIPLIKAANRQRHQSKESDTTSKRRWVHYGIVWCFVSFSIFSIFSRYEKYHSVHIMRHRELLVKKITSFFIEKCTSHEFKMNFALNVSV